MIRHVVLVRLNAAATAEGVARIRSELAALDCPGRTSFAMGPDLGLRPGNMDLAIVADFENREAFAAYDVDPEHDRIRRELIAPVAERLERCQFELGELDIQQFELGELDIQQFELGELDIQQSEI